VCTREEVKEEITTANKKMKLELLEEIHPLIVGAVKAQGIHQTAPETRKIFTAIKTNCQKTTNQFNLNQKMMQKDLKQIQKDLGEFIEQDKEWKIDFKKDLEANYAKKWTERALSTMAWIVIGGVLTALIALVLKS